MNKKHPSLEFDDIQGFILRGFGQLKHAAYVFVSFSDVNGVCAWLKDSLAKNEITPASHRTASGGTRQCIALTISGLEKTLKTGLVRETFPSELIEGMAQEHRQRLLGDTGVNGPENWRWNGSNIDALIIIVGETVAEIQQVISDRIKAENGMVEIYRQFAHVPEDGKEPFGFADGVSQPVISKTDRAKKIKKENPREHTLHSVNAGEFILGYPDGTENVPRSPAISPAIDPSGFLKPHNERPELRDFGRNGSFLVVRQLAQDVAAFNAFVEKNKDCGFDIGAKMVGRTREGKMMTTDPLSKTDNDFDYVKDLQGKGCPLGSHVRRSNPRSTVHSSSLQGALSVTNRHRILRRGRVYKNDDGETGLMFLCLNASINRQFEFVQSTWCNNRFFQGLSGEVDPIIGTQLDNAKYTIPQVPFRYMTDQLQQWVTLKGGAYFFMPSLSALNVIADIAE